MKKSVYQFFLLVVISLSSFSNVRGQCDERASICFSELKPFNSNGQYYRVQLLDNETAKLKMVFNSNLVYRIASCNQSNEGKALTIKIMDADGKIVFSNESDPNKHWDLQFGATAQYTVIANYSSGHGCAALLVGYMTKDKYAKK